MHAAGFHARVWDATVSLVRDAVPDSHMLALDMRGHGRSGNTPRLNGANLEGTSLVLLIDLIFAKLSVSVIRWADIL